MNKKIEIGQSSKIYGPNFNRSEIGRPIFSRLGFDRSRSDFLFRKMTPLKAIILLSKVMMPPAETARVAACPARVAAGPARATAGPARVTAGPARAAAGPARAAAGRRESRIFLG